MPAQARILVVEDEINLRRTLSEILRLAGYAVVAIGKGDDVLRHVACYEFDLIFMDTDSTRGDEAYLLDMIAYMRPAMSMLVLTASPFVEVSEDVEPHAHLTYVLKPVAPAHILTRIDTLLHGCPPPDTTRH